MIDFTRLGCCNCFSFASTESVGNEANKKIGIPNLSCIIDRVVSSTIYGCNFNIYYTSTAKSRHSEGEATGCRLRKHCGCVLNIDVQCSKAREQNFGNSLNYIVKSSYHSIYTYKRRVNLTACAVSFSFSIYFPHLRSAIVPSRICDVIDVHHDAKQTIR